MSATSASITYTTVPWNVYSYIILTNTVIYSRKNNKLMPQISDLAKSKFPLQFKVFASLITFHEHTSTHSTDSNK